MPFGGEENRTMPFGGEENRTMPFGGEENRHPGGLGMTPAELCASLLRGIQPNIRVSGCAITIRNQTEVSLGVSAMEALSTKC